MPSRTQQPQAFAAFLNPALVGTVQAVMAQEYKLKRGRAMAWPLAVILPVLVLHRSTRCPLYQTDASDHLLCDYLGGRRFIIK